ncbi:lipopolysaccharide biosynthesis protein [Thiothrix subterranea]|uniref:Oligosaccharide flippase family protein n=1 Tax=Thiothrix subterranea TaxID=2735563 RepID=A0AA51R3T2_9GAMM|nr:oligosaccharide flippase family protein [Thiothrix subterranea]WML85850.1 oligosaccharide flippase family protein [Thiothrix subterranea]
MAFTPIITRLYDPETFGLLGTFMAILAIFTPIAALTYPVAIVLPKSDADAVNLAKLSVGFAFGAAGIVALVIFFFGDGIAQHLNVQSIAGFLLLIPLAMLFSAFHQILQQWLIRKKQFKITARIAVVQSLLINLTKAGLGWLYPFAAVLIVLSTFGNALHAMLLLLSIRTQPMALPVRDEIDKRSSRPSNIKTLAKRHRDFPLYRAPQVMINAFSQSLPILMLASFFDPVAAGFYTLGKMVMGIPSALIGKAVGDVFYPRITEAASNKENLSKLIVKATLALAAVGFTPFMVVIIFGPSLFAFVFAAEWVEAGEYASWLALWLYTMFLTNACATAVIVIEQQKFDLIFAIYKVIARSVSLLIGFLYFGDDYISIVIFSIVSAIINIKFLFIVIYKVKKYEKR